MEFTEPTLTDDEYKKLVCETIGEYRPHVQHTIVIGREDEKVVMVCNYFRYGIETMFLHHCWFSEEYQKKIMKLKYWEAFCSYVHDAGYSYIMGVIDSRNTPALIWALKTGWTITGTRKDQSGCLIVDIIKVLQEAKT